MRKAIFLSIVITLLLSSCFIFELFTETNEEESNYELNIAWQTKTYYQRSWSYPIISDGFAYYVEEVLKNNSDYCRLIKINLDTGELIWRTKDVNVQYTDQIQKIGDYIYCSLCDREIILVFNDNDGTLAATVSLKDDVTSSKVGPYFKHTAVYNNYIFWGNVNSPKWEYQGLMRFDTNLINFSVDPNEKQNIKPELVWQTTQQNAIWTNILVNNGVVYFLTPRHDFDAGTGTVKISYLIAMDAETKEIIWQRERDFGWGDRENSLLINSDRLYVIDRNISCYNINTGEPYYEKNDKEYIDAGSDLKGLFFYNNKIYYTTQKTKATSTSPGVDPNRVKNVICIDADTGNLVWGDFIKTIYNIFTFPLVDNGKAYVVTYEGLYIYNAETGKLLGVNKTIKNRSNNHNLLYNNMVIFPNRIGDNANPPYSMLTAIRTN